MTGLHRDTVCNLIVQVGTLCEQFMERRINNVVVKDVEVDELWSYVAMKQRTKRERGIDDPYIGDAWTFVGFERNTKLVLAWHLGKRNREDAVQFLDKLNWVTAMRFQLSTDNWNGYADTVHYCFGSKVDYATVEKKYAQPQPMKRATRHLK
jgi:IS1 family transposase